MIDKLYLDELVAEYEKALRQEAAQVLELSARRQSNATAEAQVLLAAYDKNEINGKNAEVRKLQEQMVLALSKRVQESRAGLQMCEHDLRTLEVTRKAIETKISLLKAYLYSQSGLPR